MECKPWKIELPNRTLEVEFTTVSSAYHVELNPSDVGNNDRYVVQEIIKEMAKNRAVGAEGQRMFKVGAVRLCVGGVEGRAQVQWRLGWWQQAWLLLGDRGTGHIGAST